MLEQCDWRSSIVEYLRSDSDGDFYRFVGRRGDVETALSGTELLGRAGAQIGPLRQSAPGGSTVALAMSAGADFFIMLTACLLGGYTVLPLPAPGPGPTQRRLESALKVARPAILVVDAKRSEQGRELALRHEITTVFQVREGQTELEIGAPAEVAVLQPTSGTGGDAKIAMITGENILANAQFVLRECNVGPGDRVLNWLPHYHDMGLFGTFLVPLVRQLRIVQMAPLTFIQRPRRWLQALSDYRANISGTPAFGLELCLEATAAEDLGDFDLSAMKAMYCGSEPIPHDLIDRFARAMAPTGLNPDSIFASYGMSEATLYIAGKPSPQGDPSVGIYHDGKHKVAIVDPAQPIFLEGGEEGEIAFCGPSQFRGYLGRSHDDLLFEDANGDQWFRTGDLGRFRGERLIVTGRKKDILIVNGVNIAPNEIEEVAASVDKRLAPMGAAAFHVGSIDDLQTVLLIETRRSGKDALGAKLEQAMVKRVESETGLTLSRVLVLPPGSLPRTTSGKIRRAVARSRFEAGEFGAEA